MAKGHNPQIVVLDETAREGVRATAWVTLVFGAAPTSYAQDARTVDAKDYEVVELPPEKEPRPCPLPKLKS